MTEICPKMTFYDVSGIGDNMFNEFLGAAVDLILAPTLHRACVS